MVSSSYQSLQIIIGRFVLFSPCACVGKYKRLKFIYGRVTEQFQVKTYRWGLSMGNVFGSRSFEDTFRKNQDFITEMNKVKTERHIQMHNQIRERDLAMKIAHERDLALWFGAFYVLTIPFVIMRYNRTKQLSVLYPVIPLSLVFAYQVDEAYGNKLERVRQEAEMIMQFDPDKLELPCGLPTASSIDQGRLEADEKKKLHPAIPAL